MAGPSEFEKFIGLELPKRISTGQDPITLGKGLIPVSLGVGLGVEFISAEEAGIRAKSAYDLAVQNGFEGTQEEWLASLQGTIGYGVNIIGTLVTEEELEAIETEGLALGTAYFVGAHISVWNGTEWVDSNSMVGPEGKGLNYLGVWLDAVPLPLTEGYKSGDTYVWKHSLWTLMDLPTRAWHDIGVPGPKGDSAYDIATDNGFVGSEAVWLNSLIGKTAYQLAVAEGFVGSQSAWVASLKGVKGDTGLKGDQGIKGEKGDTGNKGDTGLKGDQGIKGDTGLKGDKGDKGDPVAAFAVVGTAPSGPELPRPGDPTKAYYVGTDLYVWSPDINEYLNIGTLNGPSAYDVAVKNGFVGTQPEWLTSLKIKGDKGDKGDTGLKGDKGDKGNQGLALNVLGTKATGAAIQALPNPIDQDTWISDDAKELWIYVGGAWVNTGSFTGKSAYEVAKLNGYVGTEAAWVLSLKGNKGDKGDQGIKGDTGFKGDKGEKGDRGTNVVIKGTVADEASLPPAGSSAEQDAYSAMDSGTLWMLIGGVWTSLGVYRGTNGRSLVVIDAVANKAALPLVANSKEQDLYTTLDTNTLWMSINKVWTNIGSFKGEKGDAGLKGDTGLKGDKGDRGTNVIVKGVVANKLALPLTPAEQDAYITADTLHLWMYIAAKWVDLGTHQGSGLNIIAVMDSDVAVPPVANAGNKGAAYLSFNGDLFINVLGTEWTKAGNIKGEKGETGASINLLGSVALVTDLPPYNTLEEGDAYVVTENKLLYVINDSGQYSPGVDITGPIGERGIQGEKGEAGTSITIMGSYATAVALKLAHPTGETGEGYLVGVDLWVYGLNPVGGGTEWYNVGPVRGPKGDIGPIGKDGPTGKKGDKGDRGTLWIQLPAGVDEPTSAYGVDGDWAVNAAHNTFYRAVGVGWIDMGPLVAGDVNSPLKAKGVVARLGTEWVSLPVDEVKTPESGKAYVRRYKDALTTVWEALAVDEAPKTVGKLFLRSGENGSWVEFVPSTVTEAPRDGMMYARQYPVDPGLPTWVRVPDSIVDISTKDGKMYVRVFETNGSKPIWKEVIIPSAGIADITTKDGKMYVRVFETNGSAPIWKEVTIPSAGVADISTKDGKQYARVFETGGTTPIWKEIDSIVDLKTKDGKQYARVFETAGSAPVWKEIATVPFDKYSVKMLPSTAELDLSLAQVFSVNASSARTLAFKAGTVPAADRSMTVVLVINGAGVITWPSGIVWNQSAQPQTGATTTVVTLLWDGIGNRWIGSTGATI